jgi:hypothetical protein
MTAVCDMRNLAGKRPRSSSCVSGCSWRPPGGSPPAGSTRSQMTCGPRPVRCGGSTRPGRTAVTRRCVQRAGVATETESAAVGPSGVRAAERPAAHGFAGYQRWTLDRIKTLIGKMFHVGYTAEGVWKLMRLARLVLPGPRPPGARTRRGGRRGVGDHVIIARAELHDRQPLTAGELYGADKRAMILAHAAPHSRFVAIRSHQVTSYVV